MSEQSIRILEDIKRSMVRKSIRELEDSKLDIEGCNRSIKKAEKVLLDYKQSLKGCEDLIVQYEELSSIELATKQREVLNIKEKPTEDDCDVKILELIRQDVINRNNHQIKNYINWITKEEKQIEDLNKEKEYIISYILALEKLLIEYEKIVPYKKIRKWIKEMLDWRCRE